MIAQKRFIHARPRYRSVPNSLGKAARSVPAICERPLTTDDDDLGASLSPTGDQCGARGEPPWRSSRVDRDGKFCAARPAAAYPTPTPYTLDCQRDPRKAFLFHLNCLQSL